MKNNNQTREACVDWSDDIAWNELEGLLPMGVTRRLANVDRALYASSYIAEMLVKDARGKSISDDSENKVAYAGLSVLDVEALGLAMVELNSRAAMALAEVRDNEFKCCGHHRATYIKTA